MEAGPGAESGKGGSRPLPENTDSGNAFPIRVCALALVLLMAGILFLLLAGNTFALFFARKDLFFGIPLLGESAALYLAVTEGLQIVLLILIIRYPANAGLLAELALAFSGFLLVEYVASARMAANGFSGVSVVLAFFFLMSAGLFGIHVLGPLRK